MSEKALSSQSNLSPTPHPVVLGKRRRNSNSSEEPPIELPNWYKKLKNFVYNYPRNQGMSSEELELMFIRILKWSGLPLYDEDREPPKKLPRGKGQANSVIDPRFVEDSSPKVLQCGVCEEKFASNDDPRKHFERHAFELLDSDEESIATKDQDQEEETQGKMDSEKTDDSPLLQNCKACYVLLPKVKQTTSNRTEVTEISIAKDQTSDSLKLQCLESKAIIRLIRVDEAAREIDASVAPGVEFPRIYCEQTQVTFKDFGDLQENLEGTHGRYFACKLCYEAFSQKGSLKTHIEIIHEKKKYDFRTTTI